MLVEHQSEWDLGAVPNSRMRARPAVLLTMYWGSSMVGRASEEDVSVYWAGGAHLFVLNRPVLTINLASSLMRFVSAMISLSGRLAAPTARIRRCLCWV